MNTKTALFISRIAHPLVIMPLFIVYTSYQIHEPTTALWTASGIIGITVFPLIGWILVKLKKGHYSNFDVSVRGQRFSMFAFVFLLAALLVAFLRATNQPDVMMKGCLLMIQVLLISFILNFWLKPSLHLSVCGYIAMGLWPMSQLLSLALLLIMPLLAITRIKLGRHTWQEVVLGALIGLSSGIQFLYLTDNL